MARCFVWMKTGWNDGAARDPTFRLPTIGPDGSIIAVLGHGLVAVSPHGDKLWETPGTFNFYSPAIGEDGKIVVIGGDGIVGYNPTGSLLWSYSGFGQRVAAPVGPAMDASGFGYVPLSPLGLAALNPAGRRTWAFKLETAETFAFSGITMAADGTLYAGTDNGRVIAIKSRTPGAQLLADVLHDAQHTARDHRAFFARNRLATSHGQSNS
jgi:outer membrane protein assembly factor BamB